MSSIDSGVLGKLCNPNSSAEVDAVRDWLYSLLAKGIFVVSSDICDYEVRKSLVLESLRRPKTNSLEDLNDLQDLITFLPLTTKAMKQAARIWAEAVRPRVLKDTAPHIGVRRKGTRTEAFRECPPQTNKALMPMLSSAPITNY